MAWEFSREPVSGRRALTEMRWGEVRAVTWREVMSLEEKSLYLLMLAAACGFAAMVVVMLAAVRRI